MSLDPTEEDKKWFPEIAGKGDWVRLLNYIIENFKDETLILQYLSPKVIRDMKLFSIEDNYEHNYYEVDAIHDEYGYRKVRQSLSESYNRSRYVPDIQVYKVDVYGDRTLTLEYTPEKEKRLDSAAIEKVLPHVEYLWGFPVRLIEDRREISSTKNRI
jgi:spore cortex formation protein SpoVR/YcgB (stage V sporulation)